jgi:uncharacterized protein GlcG (DUF336 family)
MLSTKDAVAMVERALAKAEEIGVSGSVAVLDAGGNLLAFARMDGAVLGSAEGAQRKAYTSVTSGMSTSQWFEIVTGDAGFGAIVGHGTEGTLFLPGGEPIVGDAGIEGAVGFSGGQPEQDVAVVAAAVG